MRTIGYAATGLVAVVLAGGLAVLVRLIPDIRRYGRMRKM